MWKIYDIVNAKLSNFQVVKLKAVRIDVDAESFLYNRSWTNRQADKRWKSNTVDMRSNNLREFLVALLCKIICWLLKAVVVHKTAATLTGNAIIQKDSGMTTLLPSINNDLMNYCKS